MKKIAVLTSGGDAPGMNACVRAVVRTVVGMGGEAWGVFRGFQGLIEGDFERMESSDVSNIIQRGGTILKSARSQQFFEAQYRKQAYEHLAEKGIDALVVIGGDGSFKGASIFSEEFPLQTIGIPGTIDNDMFGTDHTIGYDSALNTVVEAVDKIRDTASSHDRLFFIEVMGRDAGFIALRSGIAVGAEAVLVPETTTYVDHLIQKLKHDWRNNKSSSIVIVAEGDDQGGAYEVAEKVKEQFDCYDIRVSILGHMQRGGAPSAFDRVLASRLGSAAVQAVYDGKDREMAGVVNGEVLFTPFDQATKHHKTLKTELLRLAETLSI